MHGVAWLGLSAQNDVTVAALGFKGFVDLPTRPKNPQYPLPSSTPQPLRVPSSYQLNPQSFALTLPPLDPTSKIQHILSSKASTNPPRQRNRHRKSLIPTSRKGGKGRKNSPTPARSTIPLNPLTAALPPSPIPNPADTDTDGTDICSPTAPNPTPTPADLVCPVPDPGTPDIATPNLSITSCMGSALPLCPLPP